MARSYGSAAFVPPGGSICKSFELLGCTDRNAKKRGQTLTNFS
jgi:hypothetical protein